MAGAWSSHLKDLGDSVEDDADDDLERLRDAGQKRAREAVRAPEEREGAEEGVHGACEVHERLVRLADAIEGEEDHEHGAQALGAVVQRGERAKVGRRHEEGVAREPVQLDRRVVDRDERRGEQIEEGVEGVE